ncbi:hypothetical protein D3C85_1609340 [compost metagenome]
MELCTTALPPTRHRDNEPGRVNAVESLNRWRGVIELKTVSSLLSLELLKVYPRAISQPGMTSPPISRSTPRLTTLPCAW